MPVAPEKRTMYTANWRKNNPEQNKVHAKNQYLRGQKRLQAAKNSPCIDCGHQFPPECMDFDHVRGKKLYKISDIGSLADVKFYAEVAKCEVVCSNCHRIRTAEWKRTLSELRNNFMFRNVA